MGNCSAIISRVSTGTTFYSDGYLSTYAFYNNGKRNVVWDNIAINGTGLASSPHAANERGIYMTAAGSKNITINSLQIMNHIYGADIYNLPNYIYIHNTQIYNNNRGISINYGVSNITIDNTQIFNN